jgi:hypothetical protein
MDIAITFPGPFDLFLASIATCAGPRAVNPPEGFPERHRAGLLRAVESCKPIFLVTLTDTEIPCAHA